jgi:hypothetical protein
VRIEARKGQDTNSGLVHESRPPSGTPYKNYRRYAQNHEIYLSLIQRKAEEDEEFRGREGHEGRRIDSGRCSGSARASQYDGAKVLEGV